MEFFELREVLPLPSGKGPVCRGSSSASLVVEGFVTCRGWAVVVWCWPASDDGAGRRERPWVPGTRLRGAAYVPGLRLLPAPHSLAACQQALPCVSGTQYPSGSAPRNVPRWWEGASSKSPWFRYASSTCSVALRLCAPDDTTDALVV